MADLTLTFLGAAGTVTGSKFLLRASGRSYLIDCGLFQGSHEVEDANWEALPIAPSELDAVVLTHAHIDHTGYVPRLVRDGYRGPVFASEPTIALLGLLLPDAGHLEEEQAEYANRKGYARHHPALPLYTARDAERALRSLRPVPADRRFEVDDVLAVTLHRAGHILGSAIVECEVRDGDRTVTVVFTGDIGRYDQPIMREPAPIRRADYLVMESTYGDREHAEVSVERQLESAILTTLHRRGVVLIPAFAVGRTQELLFHLRRLQEAGRIPDVPVFVDSPMAVDATALYMRYGDEHNLRVNLQAGDEDSPLRCRTTHFVRAAEDSKALNERSGPAIIISASGMCSGGRVVHHLKHRLPDPRNSVLLVGFQAAGTRGRALQDGATRVRIHGEEIPVRAHVEVIDGLSAHADQEDLLRWLDGFEHPPRRVFIVHGEPDAAAALSSRIRARPGWGVTVPAHDQTVVL